MKRACVAAVWAALAVTTVLAIPVMQEIRRVPVTRLVANIERQLKERPDNVELQLNLARLYAMAYALKATEHDARVRNGNKLDAWFGYDDSDLLPGAVQPAPTRAHQQRARIDLQRAVKQYAAVVKMAPSNFIARLGYAWVLEQSGDKVAAVDQYRRVVDLAWPIEREHRGGFRDPATTEAAGRLLQLLDPASDASEMAALRDKQAVLARKPRMITPVAIALRNPGNVLPVAPNARVLFDADGSGIPTRWSWITPDAGWLVYDADGSGEITSALQWFGSVTFWLFWSNGYEAMRALDDNGDGELRGAELGHLAIWRDANQNGVSERGEVRPLSSHGIVALSCDYVAVDDPLVIAHSPRGVTFADGSRRPSYDLLLRTSAAASPPARRR